jgi:hypothetical protein
MDRENLSGLFHRTATVPARKMKGKFRKRRGATEKECDGAGKNGWCGRVDSNHHGIATASPSSWCVCQFRHDRPEKSAGKFYR